MSVLNQAIIAVINEIERKEILVVISRDYKLPVINGICEFLEIDLSKILTVTAWKLLDLLSFAV